MSNSAIMWCIDNCRSYVYYDEAVEEMREISDELDALRAREQALVAALESALKTAEFEGHPFRPWHAEARAALAAAGEASASR